MNIKVIIFALLIGVIKHDCYSMFHPYAVMPVIGNYGEFYKLGSRHFFTEISPECVPANIQRLLRSSKGIVRENVFFIVYDLSGLTSPYNITMHSALQAWTGEQLINKNLAMGFFDVEGILPDKGRSVPFNMLNKINVNIHTTKDKGILAWSPNNARFKKGKEPLGAGWFVALSPDDKSASISYLVLIYDRDFWSLVEKNRKGPKNIKNYFDALETTYEMVGSADQRIFNIILENMRRCLFPGYEPVTIKKPEPEPKPYEVPVIATEGEEDMVLITQMLELRDALRDLLDELKRPAAY